MFMSGDEGGARINHRFSFLDKGVTTDDNVYVRIAKGIILFRFSYLDDAYNFVVVENIGVFPNIL